MKKAIVFLGVCIYAAVAFASTTQQLSVTSSTAVSFTPVTLLKSGDICMVRNGEAAMMVNWNGGTATATTGIPLQANDALTLSQEEFNAFSAIASSTTGTVYGICK